MVKDKCGEAWFCVGEIELYKLNKVIMGCSVDRFSIDMSFVGSLWMWNCVNSVCRGGKVLHSMWRVEVNLK